MGVLPTKGLTLPLLSVRGSGIVANCIALAIVMRVDYENRRLLRGSRYDGDAPGSPAQAVHDRHRDDHHRRHGGHVFRASPSRPRSSPAARASSGWAPATA